MNEEIKQAICEALQVIGAPITLQAIIGSYNDTLNDEEVLGLLRNFNAELSAGVGG